MLASRLLRNGMMNQSKNSACSKVAAVQQSVRSKHHHHTKFHHYPKDVGIIAMDAYFPKTYVKQEDLEVHDGVGKGKYTIGLGQETMAFTYDNEDIYSMSLTAVDSLMKKYNISYKDIGRLEVGTETVIDKSKSVKTVLMSLFEKSGNMNVEGIDTINACYGGTSALMNAINWVESSSWDGRYALVVAGDIAVYNAGPARPTGGAGVVAMLVGPSAPIAIERGIRGSYFEHAWDFYKPNLDSEYPVVDGKLSVTCYLRALDNCYNAYRQKFHLIHGTEFDMSKAHYALFHSPYTKLVQKSFTRLAYLDYLNNQGDKKYEEVPKEYAALSAEASYEHKEMNNAFTALSKEDYKNRVEPTLLLNKKLGNTYTGSLYMSLLSLISNKPSNDLLQNRLFMFSYGSGLAATMFSLNVVDSTKEIADKANIVQRLEDRVAISPDAYTEAMKLRAHTHSKANYEPVTHHSSLFPSTFYLSKVDDHKRRHYAQTNFV